MTRNLCSSRKVPGRLALEREAFRMVFCIKEPSVISLSAPCTPLKGTSSEQMPRTVPMPHGFLSLQRGRRWTARDWAPAPVRGSTLALRWVWNKVGAATLEVWQKPFGFPNQQATHVPVWTGRVSGGSMAQWERHRFLGQANLAAVPSLSDFRKIVQLPRASASSWWWWRWWRKIVKLSSYTYVPTTIFNFGCIIMFNSHDNLTW